MELFTKRDSKALNQLVGTHIAKSPSDSTFRWLLSQLDVKGFECHLQQWIAAQPCVPEVADTLVCDSKTLWGSIAENASGATGLIALVSLYSNSLGVAIGLPPVWWTGGSEKRHDHQTVD